jgi:P pilus assembly chaperone PapD
MSKLRPLLFIIALLAGVFAHAATIVLEGNYQGKNLFVQNPYSEAGVGFCIYQVTVNDKVATDEINSSAFEVDLTNFNLKMGDKVVIKIMHKDGCTPKVLNPEVLKPKSTFDIVKQSVASDGTYTWTTVNESGQLPFVVQQKRWNKWVRVGEVMAMAAPATTRTRST